LFELYHALLTHLYNSCRISFPRSFAPHVAHAQTCRWQQCTTSCWKGQTELGIHKSARDNNSFGCRMQYRGALVTRTAREFSIGDFHPAPSRDYPMANDRQFSP
jgi:hypothetical protein